MAIKQVMQNTLSSDLQIRPEYLGLQTLMSPFAQHCATQRGMMYCSEVSQAMVLDKSEFPRVYSGYEQRIGDYEFSTCRITQDMLIREVIPKFNPMTLNDGVEFIPKWLVVAVGMDDHKVHCFEVSTYTLLHDGFGYFNKMLGFDNDILYKGNIIPKGTKLVTSPSHDGNFYKMGMNANVVFLAEWGATEDAFVISESLAKKGTNTAIQQLKLNIGIDNIPLDLYGNDDYYKCFPGIGETVRDDGVLIALRRNNKSTCSSDMLPERLRHIEQMHDETHQAPPGSKVIDVDVHINISALRKMRDREMKIYQQFIDFVDWHRYQQNMILQTYKNLCLKEEIPCAPEFNTAVFNAATQSNSKEFIPKGDIKLTDGREPIEFITITITYAYKREITVGSKLAGRDGSKGVVSAIWKDEDMPVDDYGIRADIIMTPASVINRMNPSQMYEQFWNRVAVQVVRNIKAKWLGGYIDDKPRPWIEDTMFRENWKSAYEYLMGFFHDFRPAYAKFLNETYTTDNDKKEFLEECLNEGLYLLAGFTKPVKPEHIINVAKKYGVERTPVTYRVHDPDTGEVKTIRTIKPALIGSKYLILLGKIPASIISSIEIGHVNQVKLPIKPTSKHVKSQAVIGLTPQKFGEDETCILNMSLGGPAVARLFSVHSSAPEVVQEMAKQLITEYQPTQFLGLPKTTQELVDKNQNVSTMNHLLSCVGYSVVPEKQ